jgi:hypothetical protein
MHYRIRGTNVQLVKTQPDPATGKAKSKPIGSANLLTGEINDKAADALSADERAQVEAWIARHQSIQRQKRELEYRTLPDALARVSSWIDEAELSTLKEHAEEVQGALRQLRKSLDQRLEGKERTPNPEKAEKRAERKRAKKPDAA